MCTAISYRTDSHYFGRNLDLEHCYRESVTIVPRNFPIAREKKHYAMIGIATVENGYPLFYDGTNEAGLSAAGLNFPGYAKYCEEMTGKQNIPSYDVIPAILANCRSVNEVKNYLRDTVITDKAFCEDYPPTPLHWFVADKESAIAVEMTKDGLSVLSNPIGVLANSPPLSYHLINLSNYMGLTRKEPVCRFADNVEITPFSRGQGAVGLPGDFSSASRFIRAAFVLHNSPIRVGEEDSITQFFHILSSVAVPDGCMQIGDKFQKTLYSSCCNTETGVYYYTTYSNRSITSVDMHSVDLNGKSLFSLPLISQQKVDNKTGKGPC